MTVKKMPVQIDGHTQLVGIIGWPVGHSLSPHMHNTAFSALGLNYAYVPLPVTPGRLKEAVQGLAALGFAGANVTVPHKSAILPHLDRLSPIASAIGAVNTLVVDREGKILGDNTDTYGFITDLAEHGWGSGSLSGRRALVLGAGGAARAIVYGLLQEGVEVAVANRSFHKAEELCRTIGSALRSAIPSIAPRISAHCFPQELPALAPAADLIINATRLGLDGERDSLPWNPAVPFGSRQWVYDLVPRPGREGTTPFLALASSWGAQAIGGLGMLVHQGAKAFEMWTGFEAPVEVMRAALGACAGP